MKWENRSFLHLIYLLHLPFLSLLSLSIDSPCHLLVTQQIAQQRKISSLSKTPRSRDRIRVTTLTPTSSMSMNLQGLQIAHDGKTVLIPQPSSDPNDPLNWSRLKKHVTLLVITVVAFLPDFGSSIGIVTLFPQSGYVAREKIIGKAC